MSIRIYLFPAIAVCCMSMLSTWPFRSSSSAMGHDRPNVLFIAVDDLANTLSCQGHPVIHTPHIDRLASQGVRFDRAYCQLPLCNPSRASVLTGLRPDVIRVYDLDRHFRDEVPDAVTLPQLFRRNGWFSARVGKLYHYNVPAGIGTSGLDDDPSWDLVINPKGQDTFHEDRITNPTPERPVSAAMSWRRDAGTNDRQTDGMIAAEAIRWMSANRDRRFFLGVGFFRPHTPYVAPRAYFEQYPFDRIRLPDAPADDREDIPPAAFAHNCLIPNYGLDEDTCRRALQAYFASVSFVDAQVGRLLEALDHFGLAQNTVVVLWSDHGYHLGEHQGIWQKRCLFEESARAPLVIRAPGMPGNGAACERIVEFVDIYPTVAELCGLTPPNGLSGRSLTPLLEDPSMAWEFPAFTQVLRPGNGHPVMGRSVRNERWRYTEWDAGQAGAELYDHTNDPHEFRNLVNDPIAEDVLPQLRRQLQDTVDGDVPKTPFNPSRL